jgi:hypothetical protein
MAVEIINIGVEGNDGTGDSIRQAFSKVNNNFNTLFGIFGLGGSISLVGLDDVADTPVQNAVLTWNDDVANPQVVYKTIVGEGGINVDTVTDPTVIKLQNTASVISLDTSPELAAATKISGIAAYNDLTYNDLVNEVFYQGDDPLQPTRVGLVEQWRATHGQQAMDPSKFLVPKGYTDQTYTNVDGDTMSGPLVIPSNTSYTAWAGGVVYTEGDIVTRDNNFYKAATDIPNSQNLFANNEWVNLGTVSSQAIQVSEAVKRSGDSMETGALLNLGDHPGTFAGFGNDGAPDDLQAVTKLYVDRSSFFSGNNIFVSTKGDDSQRTSPPGKEGRSQATAFASINAAARAADEEIRVSEVQPGPYLQTVTIDNGNDNSTVQAANWVTTNYPIAKQLLENNLRFITEETLAWTDAQISEAVGPAAPGVANFYLFDYNEQTWRTDLITALNGMLFDLISSDGVLANDQSILTALRLRRNHRRESLQWNAAMNFAKTRTDLVFQNVLIDDSNVFQTPATPGDVSTLPYVQFVGSQLAENAIKDHIVGDIGVDDPLFDIHKDAMLLGLPYTDALTVVEGIQYLVEITDGSAVSVDQGIEQTDPNSLVTTTDLLPGKVLRGRTSGAIGKIIKYDRSGDNDDLYLQLLEPTEFLAGEEIEYGAFVKTSQITIFIESGEYFEELPIRVPPNVSIKGDEFRRSLVYPKPGASTSPYTASFFYRDPVFDNIRLIDYHGASIKADLAGTPTLTPNEATTGYERTSVITFSSGTVPSSWVGSFIVITGGTNEGAEAYVKSVDGSTATVIITTPFLNTNANANTEFEVYACNPYGFHYLVDPTKPRDIGTDIVNQGGYTQASDLIKANRAFILAETNQFIINNYPSYTQQGTLRNRIGLLIDNLADDLVSGLNSGVLKAQKRFWQTDTITSQAAESHTVINWLKTVIEAVTTNDDTYVVLNLTDTVRVIESINGEAGTTAIINNLVDLSNYWYDTGTLAVRTTYNPAKDNSVLDVLLLNDSTVIRNITGARHGGFLEVMDPEGQILTRSPYTQTCTSSSNSFTPFRGVEKKFRGGMFNDGYVSNLQTTVTAQNVADGGGYREITVTSSAVQGGLRYRKPQTPFPFYYGGDRFTVDSISDYNAATGTAVLYLNETTPWTGGLSQDIVVQTAGNRSLLGNDFTQVNDMGYGLVVTNNALAEMVSVFTYYCHIAYISHNGGQIRSLNGSNANGKFGLVASGNDPDEIPTPVTLRDNTTQSCQIYNVDTKIQLDGITLNNVKGQTVTQGAVTGTVAFTLANSDTIYLENVTGGVFIDADLQFDTTGANTTVTAAQVLGIVKDGFTSNQNDAFCFAFDFATRPQNGSEISLYHSNLDRYVTYTIVNASDEDPVFGPFGSIAGSSGGTYDRDNVIYRLNFTAGIGGSDDNKLKQFFTHGTTATFHNRSTHVITEDISDPIAIDKLVIRPSTAIVFDDLPNTTGRTINFQLIEGTSPKEITTRFDTGLNIFTMTVALAGIGSGRGEQGDSALAVAKLSALVLEDISNATTSGNNFVFAWEGRLHTITTVDTTDVAFDVVNFTDVGGTSDISFDDDTSRTYSATGLAYTTNVGTGAGPIIRAGLQATSEADVSIRISTNRATSHDFLDIGTGGYNQSNYPEQIYGIPSDENSPVSGSGVVDDQGVNPKAQVQERSTGRVFFTSSDQDGFFRVGKFFSVDQGTGELDFGGRISFTQVTGLGFESGGAVVREFSTDGSFSNPNHETVPTELAVNTYLNRRLGADKNGTAIGATKIGPGFVPLDGGDDFQMTGNLNVGLNTITNIFTPIDTGPNASPDDHAVNKGYVLSKVSNSNTLDKIWQFESDNTVPVDSTDIMFATGGLRLFLTEDTGAGFQVGDVFRGGGVPIDDDGDPGTPPVVVTGNLTSKGVVIDRGSFLGANGITYVLITYGKVEDPATPGTFFDTVFSNTDGQLTQQTLVGSVYQDSVGAVTGIVSDINTDGAYDEIILGKQETGSVRDIQIDLSRVASGATYTTTIKDDRILNRMVNSNAGIIQSKLNMERAGVLTDSTGLEGFALEDTGQANRGLAAFEYESFAEDVLIRTETSGTLAAGDKITNAGGSLGYVVSSVSNSTSFKIRTADTFAVGETLSVNDTVSTLVIMANEPNNNLYGVERTGFINIKDKSLSYDKFLPLAADSLIGNNTDATAQPANVTMEATLRTGLINLGITEDAGNINPDQYNVAVINYNDNTTLRSVETIPASAGDLADGFVLRDGNGYIVTTGVKLSESGAVVMYLDGDQLVLNNNSATNGQILTSATGETQSINGVSTQYPLKLATSGNIEVGDITRGTSEESNFHSASAYGSAGGGAGGTVEKSALASRWIYSSFIEAPDEKDLSSTGIAIGAGTGFDNAGTTAVGNSKISIITGGGVRITTNDDDTSITNRLITENQETLFNYKSGDAQGIIHSFYKDRSDNAGSSADGDQIYIATFSQEDEQEVKRRFASIEVTAKSTDATVLGTQGKGQITFSTLASTGNGSNSTPGSEVLTQQMIIDDESIQLKAKNIDIGDGTADIVSVNGRFDTGLIPNSSAVGSLGSSTLPWNELHINGNIEPDSDQASGSSEQDLGTAGRKFRTAYVQTLSAGGNNVAGNIEGDWSLTSGSTLHATYADLAEKYTADNSYEPGTVLVLGGEYDVTTTTTKDDHRVAGVVSTNPAFIMNENQIGDNVVDLALQGRIPCKVIGIVAKGDLLVTSAMPGYAIVNNDAKPGRVIGKSLENKGSQDKGVIEIMVGRT